MIIIYFRLIYIAPIPSLLMSRGCRSEYHAVAQGEESGGEQSKVKVNRCEDTSKEYRRWKADTLAKQVHPGQLGISQETACSKVKIILHGIANKTFLTSIISMFSTKFWNSFNYMERCS